ncbi:MAG TPA: hypothetical protein VLB45_05505 [Nitrosopumilaceae archaeon]|nr:hypothetical protein [Nitrosopumilaceae archaeon]
MQKFLFISLFVIALALVLANLYGKETAGQVSNILYLIVPGALLVLSILISIRFGTKGNHAKAWIMFACFASSWFIAERMWMVYDLVYHIEPFPSWADLFYLAGYPFLFIFAAYYIKPIKNISKNTLLVAFVFSTIMLSISMYLTSNADFGDDLISYALAASYPVFDSIILFPAVVGIILFFKGKVNFLWSLICSAIIINVFADVGFLFAQADDSFYTGHPIEVLYLWSYALFSFGVYSHILIFKNHKKDPYKKDDLR